MASRWDELLAEDDNLSRGARLLTWYKNHPVIAPLIFIGIGIVIAQFAGDVRTIRDSLGLIYSSMILGK